jgi:hypothetical protein
MYIEKKRKFGNISETVEEVCFAISGGPNVTKDKDDDENLFLIRNNPFTCSPNSVTKMWFLFIRSFASFV